MPTSALISAPRPPAPAAGDAVPDLGRAPRYTSYPTAVQFGPAVDAAVYADWLAAVPSGTRASLYVHVPYCRRLCWYCGCSTQVANDPQTVSAYVQDLLAEARLLQAALGGRPNVGALHLGGGSPDCLSPDDLHALVHTLRTLFALDPDLEVAVELDPAYATLAFVEAAGRLGLTRASLGVQTLAPHVQAAVNRPQTFTQVEALVRALRAAGVASINFDLMYGLPRQTVHDVATSLESLLALRPDRLAVFGYAHVPFAVKRQGVIDAASLPGPMLRLEQEALVRDRLLAEGYVPVGLDHFALPGDSLARAAAAGTLRRNFQGYTTDDADLLMGLGASAISKTPFGFAQNAHAPRAWRDLVRRGAPPTVRGVAFKADDRVRGAVIEALMCAGRADLAQTAADQGAPADAFIAGVTPALAPLEAAGLVSLEGARIELTAKGRPFVRSVCAAFDRYLEASAGRHASAV